jgi:hypothetical protein
MRHEERGEQSGKIAAGVVYGLDEFTLRTELGDAGLRQARRSGLKVRYAHNRGFVIGADWFEYLEEKSTTNPPGPSKGQDPRRRSEGGEE